MQFSLYSSSRSLAIRKNIVFELYVSKHQLCISIGLYFQIEKEATKFLVVISLLLVSNSVHIIVVSCLLFFPVTLRPLARTFWPWVTVTATSCGGTVEAPVVRTSPSTSQSAQVMTSTCWEPAPSPTTTVWRRPSTPSSEKIILLISK